MTRLIATIEFQEYNTEILKTFLLQNKGEISDQLFYYLASKMHDENVKPTISYLPNGVLSLVYPTKFQTNLGVNILEHPDTSADAKLTRDSGEMVISGPFDLIQGGVGIVIRNPVFMNGKFKGFFAVSLDLEALLNYTGINNLANLGYEYGLMTNYEGSEIIASKSKNFKKDEAFSKSVTIGLNQWSLCLYITNRRTSYIMDGLFWFFLILLFNLIFTFFIYRLEIAKKRLDNRLEKDLLTGVFNRLKLEKFALSPFKKPYALFFVDLNKFKPVNDTYGHEIGDKLLIAYTRRLQTNLKVDSIIARIGGDEFVLLVPHVLNIESANKIKERIKLLSEHVFKIGAIQVQISASVGIALSSESHEFKKILELADERMYEEKGHRD